MKNPAIGPGWRTTMWRGVVGHGKLAREGSRSVCGAADGGAAGPMRGARAVVGPAGRCRERSWRPRAARWAGRGPMQERGAGVAGGRGAGVAWATLVGLIKD